MQRLTTVSKTCRKASLSRSPTGFICAFFATIMGFALIWHIWWMVGLAALGAYATFVVFAWRDKVEYIIPAETVARIVLYLPSYARAHNARA
jgi:cytochrome o ubiquinol oxidase subunit 1